LETRGCLYYEYCEASTAGQSRSASCGDRGLQAVPHKRQIEIINPKVIVTLGRFAMNYFAPYAKMTRDHGRVLLVDGRTVFPVYHPAAALRSTQMMEVFREDLAKLPKVVSGRARRRNRGVDRASHARNERK
jgi:hypothetical protein